MLGFQDEADFKFRTWESMGQKIAEDSGNQ